MRYFSPERELGLELLLASLRLAYLRDLLAGGETTLLLARWSWDREVRGGAGPAGPAGAAGAAGPGGPGGAAGGAAGGL